MHRKHMIDCRQMPAGKAKLILEEVAKIMRKHDSKHSHEVRAVVK